MRVPAVDPKRDKLIQHFEKKLAYFRRIPAHRREDEAADEGEATCRAMLAGLRGERRAPDIPDTSSITLDRWIDLLDGANKDKG